MHCRFSMKIAIAVFPADLAGIRIAPKISWAA